MAKVENTSSHKHITVRDKSGKAHSIAPGATETININAEATAIQAKVNAGLLIIDGQKTGAAKTTRSQTDTGKATAKSEPATQGA